MKACCYENLKKSVLKVSSVFVRGPLSKIINYLSPSSYMKMYLKHLKRCGITISGTPNYIAPDVYFDGHGYSIITINDGRVISKEVLLLTHDYSIARGIEAVRGRDWAPSDTPHFLKEIYIGKNSFIGARSILLPGTCIGDNCIVGAGSIVKGTIPDNSIVVGNPAKVLARTEEWDMRHIDKHDYLR